LQGLKRFREDADLDADYFVVEMAKNLLGPDWLHLRAASQSGRDRTSTRLIDSALASGL
jgi:hypothetical protein